METKKGVEEKKDYFFLTNQLNLLPILESYYTTFKNA
jgi:hypothetical protein